MAGADRLVVLGRTGLIQPLPMPYYPRIQRIPGVKDAAHATWFGGIYQEPKNFFPQFAVDPDSWVAMYPEFMVDPAQWHAFKADRQGVMIGRKLAERFGWKIGDRIPLKAPGYFGGNALGVQRPGDLQGQPAARTTRRSSGCSTGTCTRRAGLLEGGRGVVRGAGGRPERRPRR